MSKRNWAEAVWYFSGLMWLHYAVFRLTKSEPLGGAESYKIIITTLQGVYHLCVYVCVCVNVGPGQRIWDVCVLVCSTFHHTFWLVITL